MKFHCLAGIIIYCMCGTLAIALPPNYSISPEPSRAPNHYVGAAKIINVSADQDSLYGPYLADLQRRIKRAWFPPKGIESKMVVVVFKLHRGGELSNLRLEQSCGVAIADQAALKAVENASPFRRLPQEGLDELDIRFTFDYNLFCGRVL